jgi:DNA-binding NarL/FixJ family response regulator
MTPLVIPQTASASHPPGSAPYCHRAAWYTGHCSQENIHGGKVPMADVVALIDDIFFQGKVQQTAKLTGVTLQTASTVEQLLAAAVENPAALLIVDLNARCGPLEAIESLCQSSSAGNPRRVIAFLSHVQTELANRAVAAGCQQVMPRSAFTQNLAAILRGAKV